MPPRQPSRNDDIVRALRSRERKLRGLKNSRHHTFGNAATKVEEHHGTIRTLGHLQKVGLPQTIFDEVSRLEIFCGDEPVEAAPPTPAELRKAAGKAAPQGYQPGPGTGAYALLLAMYRAERDHGSTIFGKRDLIQLATPLCNTSFTDANGQGMTAWKAIDTLADKQLVDADRRSRRPGPGGWGTNGTDQFKLTGDGKALARQLDAAHRDATASPRPSPRAARPPQHCGGDMKREWRTEGGRKLMKWTCASRNCRVTKPIETARASPAGRHDDGGNDDNDNSSFAGFSVHSPRTPAAVQQRRWRAVTGTEVNEQAKIKSALSQARTAKRVVLILYSGGSRPGQRPVLPTGPVSRSNNQFEATCMLTREGRHFKLSGVSTLWQAEEVARSTNHRRRVSTTDRLGGGGMASGGSGQLDRDHLRNKRLQALGQATGSACSGAGAGASAGAGTASATPQLFRGASARSSGSMNADAGNKTAGRKRRRSHSFEGVAAAAGAAASSAGTFATDRSPPAKRTTAPEIAGACYTGSLQLVSVRLLTAAVLVARHHRGFGHIRRPGCA